MFMALTAVWVLLLGLDALVSGNSTNTETVAKPENSNLSFAENSDVTVSRRDFSESWNTTSAPDDVINSTTESSVDSRASVEREARTYMLYQIGWYIHLVWLPVIVPLGLLGNALSFLVMIQKENRRISCCLYMATLAVSDSVALFRKGYEWLIYMFGKPYVVIECKSLAYFGLGSIQYGMFLILGMTVDRVLAITFPLKAQIYCAPKRAKWTILALLVTAALFNIPHFITSRPIEKGYTCATFTIPMPYIEIYAWVSDTINFFIPFVLLLVMNSIIFVTIRNRGKALSKSRGSSTGTTKTTVSREGSEAEAERQLAIMLSLIGASFIILNVPQGLRLTMFFFVDRWQDPSTYATYIFVFHVANKLYYTNNAINFFLYCIGGSKFRQRLRGLVCAPCTTDADVEKETLDVKSTTV